MKNYLKEVSNKELADFLKSVGYEPAYDVKNKKNGKILPAFDRYEPKNEEETPMILIRCRKIPNEIQKSIQMPNKLSKIIATFEAFSANYDLSLTVIFVDNFIFNESLVADFLNTEKPTKNNQAKFTDFMVKKFGKEYIEDYNKFVDEYNAKLKEEQEKENEQDELSL